MKYPGKLGQRGLLNQVLKDAEISDVLSGRARQQHEARMLWLLCRHYGITGPAPLTMMAALAVALARDHVPGFILEPVPSKRGRPKPSLGDLLANPKPLAHEYGSSRPRGAPTKWTTNAYRELLRLLEKGTRIQRQNGGRVTNASAIEAALRQMRDDGHLQDWTDVKIRSEAKARARRVSDAQKALQKIGRN